MIGISEEYEKMFRLEEQLWWYRILHERVEIAIQKQYGTRRDLAILDAGCGTGGMLHYLQRRGYTNLRGIDGSTDAVAYCHERGLNVSLVNLTQLSRVAPDRPYDVIICNDVFCYFDEPALHRLVPDLSQQLRPDGLLVSNNNAFDVFRGQHDLAVGSSRRFVRADFEQLLPPAGLQLTHATYWSFLLSPLILAMRQWQNWQLRLGWRAVEQAQSDVYLPGRWVNETLYRLVRAEQRLLPRTPFGSSLFLTAKKIR